MGTAQLVVESADEVQTCRQLTPVRGQQRSRFERDLHVRQELGVGEGWLKDILDGLVLTVVEKQEEAQCVAEVELPQQVPPLARLPFLPETAQFWLDSGEQLKSVNDGGNTVLVLVNPLAQSSAEALVRVGQARRDLTEIFKEAVARRDLLLRR